MRILVVTQYFWPESFRINDLVAGLTEKGHAVTVVTGMPNYPSGELFKGYGVFTPAVEKFGETVVYRCPLFTRGRGSKWRLALNYLSFALSASALAPLRCRGSFDVIFVYEPSPVTVGIPAVVMKKLKKMPILFWVQDLWPDSLVATGAVTSHWILEAVAKLVRFIYRHCDCILVQSEGFISRVSQMGVESRRIHYFPNWAEAFYRPLELNAEAPELHELPQGFRVLFAGNIGVAQSFDTILTAAEQLKAFPDIQWIIVGDGHLKEWVQDQISARGLTGTVHLLGSRPAHAMPRYFAAADTLLVTLKRDPAFAFTVPSKVQSYLACGRPIIAALDGEGAKVIERSGAGFAAAAEDAQDLAARLLTLYRMSPDARRDMGMRGRQYYEAEFGRDRLITRLEQIMGKVAGAVECAS